MALATWIDLVALGVGDADFAQLLLVGHVAAGLLNRLRRRLLADGVDVAALVVMSVMLTLISTRPIFFSSGSSEF